MPTVKAKGALRHHFHGEYMATVGLMFESEAHAADALRALGAPWKCGETRSDVLVVTVGSDALDDIKARFKGWGLEITPCGYKHCRHQCRDAEIDHVAHSVDLGAAFTVTIPTQPAEQVELF